MRNFKKMDQNILLKQDLVTSKPMLEKAINAYLDMKADKELNYLLNKLMTKLPFTDQTKNNFMDCLMGYEECLKVMDV
ncbi:hypothetical protein DAMA08_021070 (mitochondrion) [Martiniozyma asiatica (nom. inval.)]|nr:hypothetical protein DAMA08_021070 [Martiniozyma asiatica]